MLYKHWETDGCALLTPKPFTVDFRYDSSWFRVTRISVKGGRRDGYFWHPIWSQLHHACLYETNSIDPTAASLSNLQMQWSTCLTPSAPLVRHSTPKSTLGKKIEGQNSTHFHQGLNIVSPGTHFPSGLMAQSSQFFPVVKERSGIRHQCYWLQNKYCSMLNWCCGPS
jgi:hypothetical protein